MSQIWWGEAPERLYDISEGGGVLGPDIIARPIRPPSRDSRVMLKVGYSGTIQASVSEQTERLERHGRPAPFRPIASFDLALVPHSFSDGGSEAAPRARLRLPALPQLRIGRTAG